VYSLWFLTWILQLARFTPSFMSKKGMISSMVHPSRLLMKPSIGQEVVNKSAEVLQMMRRKGFPVLHVRTGHAENLSDSSRQDLKHMW